MSRSNIVKVLSVVVLMLGTLPVLAATVIYQVGNCKPRIQNFSTISGALSAFPYPNVLLVCPGTYNEQIMIPQPVTLEGVTTTGSAQAIIASPTGGLAPTAGDDIGNPIAAQILVLPEAGSVNISNITIDGTNNGQGYPVYVAGIFYQNSSGTLSHVTARNQSTNGTGVGIWLEGGSFTPTVTVENSDVHGFDSYGIYSETAVSNSNQNSAIIKDNVLQGEQLCSSNGTISVCNLLGIGIYLFGASANTVTGNLITAEGGIDSSDQGNGTLPGTIAGNTIVGTIGTGNGAIITGSEVGIVAGSAQDPVTGNKIVNSNEGVLLQNNAVTVEHNTIIDSDIGIEFDCVNDSNVNSNTILDASVGIDTVPAGLTPINSYINVATILTRGCSAE
jgi:nitrous oxidase accessory protein NosD